MKYPKGIRPDFSLVQAVSGIKVSDRIKKETDPAVSFPTKDVEKTLKLNYFSSSKPTKTRACPAVSAVADFFLATVIIR